MLAATSDFLDTPQPSMSPFMLAIVSVLLGALLSFIHLRWKVFSSTNRNNGLRLPPGPLGLPIIGNLHMLGSLPHRTLHEMAKKYGPLMSLRLGYVPTIVVSSPEAAEPFLRTHDTIFASRPKLQVSDVLSYGRKGMAFTEYGPYWRKVRKFCTLELLTAKKIDPMAGMRREELCLLVNALKKSAVAREVVDLSEKVAELIEDMTYRMLFGRCNDDGYGLKGTIREAMELAGAFNLADYLPFLKPLDLQGFTQRLKATSTVLDKIIEIIIKEHEENVIRGTQNLDKDFIDVMLSLMNKSTNTRDELSYTIDRTNIKAIILDMVAGAVDTSNTAIEWILSELIMHPRVMKRLQEELLKVVGGSRMVEETDLPKLEYLDMVVKESLRLHPVAALLVPHESMEDIMIDGYHIPKKSRIIINYWSFGRDPQTWSENVEEFLPERFIGSNIDLRGHDLQLIPFGAGRRGCPGMHLGLINIKLVVSQITHCFDWELLNGMSPSAMDMSERFGLSTPRAKNLLALPTYRLHGANF